MGEASRTACIIVGSVIGASLAFNSAAAELPADLIELTPDPSQNCLVIGEIPAPDSPSVTDLSPAQQMIVQLHALAQATDEGKNDLAAAARDFVCKSGDRGGYLGEVVPLADGRNAMVVTFDLPGDPVPERREQVDKGEAALYYFEETEHLGEKHRDEMDVISRRATSVDPYLLDFLSRIKEADAVSGAMERAYELRETSPEIWSAALEDGSHYQPYAKAYLTGRPGTDEARAAAFAKRFDAADRLSEMYRKASDRTLKMLLLATGAEQVRETLDLFSKVDLAELDTLSAEISKELSTPLNDSADILTSYPLTFERNVGSFAELTASINEPYFASLEATLRSEFDAIMRGEPANANGASMHPIQSTLEVSEIAKEKIEAAKAFIREHKAIFLKWEDAFELHGDSIRPLLELAGIATAAAGPEAPTPRAP